MPAKPRPAAEKGAIALMAPAGLVGYLLRGEWAGTSILIPGVLSGLIISIIVSAAKPSLEERLWPLVAPAVVAMHLIGGATISLLASVAFPDITTRAGLLPILEWTRPTSLAVFALVDLITLALLGLVTRKR